jgi:hypothetical protein
MAREEKCESVPGTERAHGTLCGRVPGECRELRVADDLAARDRAERTGDRELEVGEACEIERDVPELDVGSTEEGGNAARELPGVDVSRTRRPAQSRHGVVSHPRWEGGYGAGWGAPSPLVGVCAEDAGAEDVGAEGKRARAGRRRVALRSILP